MIGYEISPWFKAWLIGFVMGALVVGMFWLFSYDN